MARNSTNFSELATGTGVPTGYSEPFGAQNATYSINTDAGSPGGQSLNINKSGAGRAMLSWDITNSDTNPSALALVEMDTGTIFSLWICGSESAGLGTESGYLVELVQASNTIRLWRVLTGTYTALTATAAVTLTAGTKYWVRISRTSSTGNLKVRAWAYGTKEPTAWHRTATDANLSSGWTGVSELATGPGIDTVVHHLSAGSGFDCGCEVLEEDFPTDMLYISAINTDDSIRARELVGAERFFTVAIFDNTVDNLQHVKWHKTKDKLYATFFNAGAYGGVVRMGPTGTAREILRTGLASLSGLTFDYDNSLMYYVERVGITGDLMKNSDDGGSETVIVSNAINWPGGPYFNADDGYIYVPYDFAVRAYDASGTLIRTYPTLTNNIGIAVIVDATNVIVGYHNLLNSYYRAIGDTASAWTNWATDRNYHDYCFDVDDRSILYASDFDNDIVDVITNLTPPSTSNRTNIETGTHIDGALSVDHRRVAVSGGGLGLTISTRLRMDMELSM